MQRRRVKYPNGQATDPPIWVLALSLKKIDDFIHPGYDFLTASPGFVVVSAATIISASARSFDKDQTGHDRNGLA
jgi:hypothetical protein